MEIKITGLKHDAGQIREWLSDYSVEAVTKHGETITLDITPDKETQTEIIALLKSKVDEPVVDPRQRMIDELKAEIAPALGDKATIADLQAAITTLAKHAGIEV